MTERNLWKEWWAHFLRFNKETRDVYDLGVKTGNIDMSWTKWIEGLRREWFKEMMEADD